MTWISVILGGAAGCAARHAVNLACARFTGSAMPMATATVNLTGSLLIGALAGLIAIGKLHLSPHARTFVFVGILGGFTTFSSFMLDTLTLVQTGRNGTALANVALQLAGGVVCVWAGYHGAVALR
jgi:fluoride exporter